MPSSKRPKGYPSETRVKRGSRVVHGDKELLEKLGRNDLCPCGSGRKFKKCCLRRRAVRWHAQRPLSLGTREQRREQISFRYRITPGKPASVRSLPDPTHSETITHHSKRP